MTKYVLIVTKPDRRHNWIKESLAPYRFPDKVSARRYAIGMMAKNRNIVSIHLYPTSCVGENGEYYDTVYQRYNNDDESINRETVKNRIVWYRECYNQNGEKEQYVLNKDGTSTKTLLHKYILARDPHFYDWDF